MIKTMTTAASGLQKGDHNTISMSGPSIKTIVICSVDTQCAVR